MRGAGEFLGGALPIPPAARRSCPTNATVTILNNNIGVAFVNATNYVSETNSRGDYFVQRIGKPTAMPFGELYHDQRHRALAGINYTTITGTLAFVAAKPSRRFRAAL